MRFYFLYIFFLISYFSSAQINISGKTEIIKSNEGFQLLRNGHPYYVNGAGGNEYLDVLKSIGEILFELGVLIMQTLY